jgi:hypothetical protein
LTAQAKIRYNIAQSKDGCLMRTYKLSLYLLIIGLVCFNLLQISTAGVYNYSGNGNSVSGAWGSIGLGSLTLSDSGSTIRGTVNLGGDSATYFKGYLMLYIDSKPGGFANTASFADVSTPVTRSISGYNGGTGRATANFAPNFAADYAIVLSRTGPASALYELASGTALGPSKNLTFTDNGTSWQFSFNLNDIGASAASFNFQSTITSDVGSGYRYLESYEPLTGTGGFNTVNFGNFNTFGVETVPETTNAALAVFGGLVLTASVSSRVRRYLVRKA